MFAIMDASDCRNVFRSIISIPTSGPTILSRTSSNYFNDPFGPPASRLMR